MKNLHWLMLVFFLSWANVTANGQWPQRGGPTGNHHAEIKTNSKSIQAPRWEVPLAASDSETVVSGNRLFVTSLDFTDAGEEAHRITALDLTSGERLWSTLLPETSYPSQDISSRYPVRPLATPVIAADRLITVGYGSSVHCVDVASGSLIWKVDLVRDFAAEPLQYGAATSPWSDGTQVIVACGGAKALLISFDIASGKVRWTCGMGGASYSSFAPFLAANGKQELVYLGQDELIGIEPTDGSVHWKYPLPKVQLTNAVTPLCVAPGKLLVGGQGIGGAALLSIDTSTPDQVSIIEVWKMSRPQPFYCNWMQPRSYPERVVGFAGKTLVVLDWATGEIVSQIRGWTDCNVTDLKESFLVARGDGFLGLMKLENEKPTLIAGNARIRDRVWSAPVVVGDQILIRGKRSLYSVGMDEFKPGVTAPTGTDVTSMDAMYGTRSESVTLMINLATESTAEFSWEDYQAIASDRSSTMSEGDYLAVVEALTKKDRWDLAYRVVEDWQTREPESIVAFERAMNLLDQLGRGEQARVLESKRLVKVTFRIRCDKIPDGVPALYVAGNVTSLGSWKAKMLKLERQADGTWRGEALIPKGELLFKITGGDWETEETRADGRSISNRRARIVESKTVDVSVATLKPPKAANR